MKPSKKPDLSRERSEPLPVNPRNKERTERKKKLPKSPTKRRESR